MQKRCKEVEWSGMNEAGEIIRELVMNGLSKPSKEKQKLKTSKEFEFYPITTVSYKGL